jgi:hypothetical protein
MKALCKYLRNVSSFEADFLTQKCQMLGQCLNQANSYMKVSVCSSNQNQFFGSGIRCLFDLCTWDPGSGMGNQDPDPG